MPTCTLTLLRPSCRKIGPEIKIAGKLHRPDTDPTAFYDEPGRSGAVKVLCCVKIFVFGSEPEIYFTLIAILAAAISALTA
jgi:hypothetical protein